MTTTGTPASVGELTVLLASWRLHVEAAQPGVSAQTVARRKLTGGQLAGRRRGRPEAGQQQLPSLCFAFLAHTGLSLAVSRV
jgi:hypothetical protein